MLLSFIFVGVWIRGHIPCHLGICIIFCRVIFFCITIWVIDLNVKRVAVFSVLMLWQLLPLTFACICLGVTRSILHILSYTCHITAFIQQNFSFCILEVVNNFCLLGICEFHVILTAHFLAFNDLAHNIKCVLWFAFYCILLNAFCRSMYWVSGSVHFETGDNHNDVTYILVTCDVTRWLDPDVSKTLDTLRNVLQTGRSRVRFSTGSLEIFINVIFLAAIWS